MKPVDIIPIFQYFCGDFWFVYYLWFIYHSYFIYVEFGAFGLAVYIYCVLNQIL